MERGRGGRDDEFSNQARVAGKQVGPSLKTESWSVIVEFDEAESGIEDVGLLALVLLILVVNILAAKRKDPDREMFWACYSAH